MENCCESIVKYLIFTVNFVFAVTGLLLIGFGAYVYTQANSHPELELKGTDYILIFMITFGIFIFFVSFFGCYGALLENRCMLFTYAALLIAIVLVEVFVAISAYVRLPEIIQDMKTEMIDDLVVDYYINKNVTKFWDDLQKKNSCCGIISYKDWPTFYIPSSCCKEPPCNKDRAYKVGCFAQVEGVLTIAAHAAVGIWLFQYLTIICSCWIVLRSKKAENGEFLMPRNMRNAECQKASKAYTNGKL